MRHAGATVLSKCHRREASTPVLQESTAIQRNIEMQAEIPTVNRRLRGKTRALAAPWVFLASEEFGIHSYGFRNSTDRQATRHLEMFAIHLLSAGAFKGDARPRTASTGLAETPAPTVFAPARFITAAPALLLQPLRRTATNRGN